MDELPTYEYTPLSHPSDIRLINLYPAPDVTNAVVITISHHKRLSLHLKRLFNIDFALQKAKRHLEIVRMERAREQAVSAMEWCDESTATADSDDAGRGPTLLQIQLEAAYTKAYDLEQEHTQQRCDQIHAIRQRRNAGLPRYEAVSYAWGAEMAEQCISHISGTGRSSLYVRNNVAEMLRYLRSKTSSRYLWIDSICINQTDTEEKEYQVRQMGPIYADAARVLIWLGLHSGQFDPNPNNNCNTHNANGNERVCEDCVAESTRDLIRQKWFQRRWIIQEVALACEARVICGGHAYVDVEFQHFVRDTKARLEIFDTKSGYKLLNRFDRDVLHRLHTMATLQFTNSNQFRPRKMRDLLLEFSAAECSESRDILFALNSLSVNPVFVSYRLSVEEIFTEYATHELEIDPSALLACAGAFPTASSSLPSWVPDWRTPQLYHPLSPDCYANSYSWKKFTAENHTQLFDILDNELRIMAARLDEVEIVCSDSSLSAWIEFYQKHGERGSLENGSDPGFTFFSTITANLASDSNGDLSELLILLSREGQRAAASPEDKVVEFQKRVMHVMTGRVCFFSKRTAMFGIGPRGIRKGDLLVYIPGRLAFFALRQQVPGNETTASRDLIQKKRIPAIHPLVNPLETLTFFYAIPATLVGECYVPEFVTSNNIRDQHNLQPFSII